MCKTWFLCEAVAGDVHDTPGAKAEGIIEARWFARDELLSQTVFPSILMQYEWASFASADWKVIWMGLRRANF
jgi:hypothetical protein